MDQIEEIKSKVDIVELVGEYVTLKKAGRHYKGNCPFHQEKTPSFVVSPELQIYKCFGCSAGGDSYRFLMEYEKVDFSQALKILADRVGIKLKQLKGFSGSEEKEELYKLNYYVSEFYHYLLFSHQLGKKALAYLNKRGINDETAKAFKLGFAPSTPDVTLNFLNKKKGYKLELLEKAGIVYKKDGRYFDRFRDRLMFPLKDHFGNVLGFAGRIIENKNEVAKYINTSETKVYKKGNLLFGLDLAKQEIKKAGLTIVVEGEFDCISSWQAGVKNVVAIKGSALTDEQVMLLSRFCSKVVLALDSDLAGDQAARRGIQTAEVRGLEVRVASLGNFKDPDEYAQKDPDGWKKAILESVGVYDFFVESVFSRFDPKTAEGKAGISRQLVPILSNITDEIVKAHYARIVAEKLDVPENSVIAQISKLSVQPFLKWEHPTPVVETKQRRQLLEERLIGLVVQTNSKLLMDSKFISLIATPGLIRLVSELAKSSDLAHFSESIPDELRNIFADTYLVDLGIDLQDISSINEEITNTLKSLEVLDTREKISDIAERIKKTEKGGTEEEVGVLEENLTELSKKLTELEN